MPHSSAQYVAFDLRPAKQTERRILIDMVGYGESCGLNIGAYRYVGMGANRFYDFMLFHRYLGIRDMVSLEHDPEFYERAKLNAPYGFIDVMNLSAGDFLSQDEAQGNTVYWFDYDDGISQEILSDIYSLASNAVLGDFFFVTVLGVPPGETRRMSSRARVDWYQDTFGDLAAGIEMGDCEDQSFRRSVHKILYTALRNAFAANEGVFSPLMQITYADGTPMVTVGGSYLGAEVAPTIEERCRQDLSFLEIDEMRAYRIPSLALSDRERAIFDRAATIPRRNCREANLLRAIGFKDEQIQQYRDLLRHMPRYVETIV